MAAHNSKYRPSTEQLEACNPPHRPPDRPRRLRLSQKDADRVLVASAVQCGVSPRIAQKFIDQDDREHLKEVLAASRRRRASARALQGPRRGRPTVRPMRRPSVVARPRERRDSSGSRSSRGSPSSDDPSESEPAWRVAWADRLPALWRLRTFVSWLRVGRFA